MIVGQIKPGRNDACPCGSGNKYKRCCLSSGRQFTQEKPLIDPKTIQNSMHRLKTRVQDNMGGTCVMHDGELGIKMSEVILDLADDLLEHAKTKSEYHSAISITCIAWNLAVMDSSEYEAALERGLKKIDDPVHQDDTLQIIDAIIKKKNRLHPNIKRVILDYELVGNKNNFHLNVVSNVPKEEISELI
jgi:hypothetical protein